MKKLVAQNGISWEMRTKKNIDRIFRESCMQQVRMRVVNLFSQVHFVKSEEFSSQSNALIVQILHNSVLFQWNRM